MEEVCVGDREGGWKECMFVVMFVLMCMHAHALFHGVGDDFQ